MLPLRRALPLPLLLLLTACGGKGPEPDTNPVLMTVGDSGIRLEAWRFYMNKNYPEVADSEDHELLSTLFDQFRRDVVIAEIGQALGFRVSEDQVDDFVNTRLTEVDLSQLPAGERGLWRDAIRRRLAIQQFLEREILDEAVVTEGDVAHYFEEHPEEFEHPALYHLRFVQTTTEDAAKAFRKALRGSGKTFQEVAAEHAENEGYQIAVPLSMDELGPFKKAVQRMKPGQYSRIVPVKQAVKTEDAEFEHVHYYVLYLESETPATHISYEEAYEGIREELVREKCRKLLDERVRLFEHRIPVEVFEDQLPFTYLAASQRSEV